MDSTITAAEVIGGASVMPEEHLRAAPALHARSVRRKPLRGGAAIAAIIAAGLVLAPALRPARSPLIAPSSVLGCPVMEVSGVEDPAGWLGAAAASLFCERARVVLGGTTGRTRIPAELLGLPREPADDLPADPYAAAGARRRTRETARRLADAYIDGSVIKDGSSLRIELVLRTRDTELGRAQGHGSVLSEAVRSAMQPLIEDGLLPQARALDPTVADFSQARDPAAALALFDFSMAMINNAGDLSTECAMVDQLGDRTGEMRSLVRFLCA